MKFSVELERYRVHSGPYASRTFETFGAFRVPGPCGRELMVIASSGDESLGILWEHVSVSLPNRCPNWPEMEFIAGLFFKDDETAMQLHVPASDHVNNHPYCLQWWRPQNVPIPRPDAMMVGVKDEGLLSPDRVQQMRRQIDEMVAAKMAPSCL